jgi:transposase
MGRPYSEDLRSRIVAAVESGMSRNAAARHFAVNVSCVVKLMQRFRRTGTVAPASRGKSPMCWPATKRRFATWFLTSLT